MFISSLYLNQFFKFVDNGNILSFPDIAEVVYCIHTQQFYLLIVVLCNFYMPSISLEYSITQCNLYSNFC